MIGVRIYGDSREAFCCLRKFRGDRVVAWCYDANLVLDWVLNYLITKWKLRIIRLHDCCCCRDRCDVQYDVIVFRDIQV